LLDAGGILACNPSNSGGSDQEDHGLKSTWANRPYFKKHPSPKKGLVGMTQGVLGSSPSTTKKKKKKEIVPT
jgi:hypothetical protein